MRDLHVVALSEDGQHVVLATRPGIDVGEFRVALDDRLTAAVRGELPRPGASAPPHVSPKEIQARLRSGESVEQIAASAGVPVSRVERFAGPVLSELDRVITGARDAVVTRARRGPSDLPLGRAVDQHLAEASGLQPGSTVWSARRDGPGRWLVEVTWTARARVRTASWSYEPATRQVTPVDAPSAALAHVDLSEAASARPVRAPAGRAVAPAPARATAGTAVPKAPAKEKTAAKAKAPVKEKAPTKAPTKAKAPTKGKAADRGKATAQGEAPVRARTAAPAARTAPTPAARPAAGASRSARPTAPAPAASAPRTRAAPTGTGRPAARTRPAPAASSAGTRAAARPAAARPASAAHRAAPPARPVPEVRPGPPLLRVVPPVEDHPGPDAAEAAAGPPARPASDAAPVAPARVRRAAGQRASVPDWADVLLGTASASLPSAGEGPERSS